MERLGDLVNPAVKASHRVVHLGFASDAAHFPDDEAGATAVHHLHGGSADVLLGGKRLAEVILKARKRVAVGDVEWSQGMDRFATQDRSIGSEVAVHGADLVDGQNLVGLLRLAQPDQCPIVDRIVGCVPTRYRDAVKVILKNRGHLRLRRN